MSSNPNLLGRLVNRLVPSRIASRMASEDPIPVEEVAEREQKGENGRRLDPETRARRDDALAHILKIGDPILRSRALPVEHFDAQLQLEVQRMERIMDDALGIGLAATQVGVLSRLLVYRVEEDGPLGVLANPVIEWSSPETDVGEEGCLSIPGVLVDVERPAAIRVRGQDQYGNSISLEVSELEARVIQHEIDHLDGVMILDRTSREQRKQAMKVLREADAAARRPD